MIAPAPRPMYTSPPEPCCCLGDAAGVGAAGFFLRGRLEGSAVIHSGSFRFFRGAAAASPKQQQGSGGLLYIGRGAAASPAASPAGAITPPFSLGCTFSLSWMYLL